MNTTYLGDLGYVTESESRLVNCLNSHSIMMICIHILYFIIAIHHRLHYYHNINCRSSPINLIKLTPNFMWPLQYQWFYRLAAWGLILLHIFERPIWTYHADYDYRQGSIYPSFQLSYIDEGVALILKVICILCLCLCVVVQFGFKWGTANTYMTWVFAAIMMVKIIEIIIITVEYISSGSINLTASPLEAILCLLVELRYEHNIGYVLRTIPKFALSMLVLAFFICIYTSLGRCT